MFLRFQATNLGQRRGPKKGSKEEWDSPAGASLGAETLLHLLKNYARNSGLKTAITVGIVGLPNVGKSSLINSLKRARVANVGNTPGETLLPFRLGPYLKCVREREKKERGGRENGKREERQRVRRGRERERERESEKRESEKRESEKRERDRE